MLTGYGTETFIHVPTCPANKGNNSCEVYTHFPSLLLLTELCILSILLCSTYVALKLQFCDEASSVLLINLLCWNISSDRIDVIIPNIQQPLIFIQLFPLIISLPSLVTIVFFLSFGQ